MTREEQINKEAYRQEGLVDMDVESFIAGAKWADKNPKFTWISVEEDLPCNHEEFIETGGHYLKETIEFITIDEYDVIVSNLMVLFDNGKWEWKYGARPRYWMQIPELPKRIGD